VKRTLLVASLLVFLPFVVPLAHAAEAVKVTASDGSANDRFGAAMASTRSLVAIGAPGATVNGRSGQGAVYIFERVDCTLREIAKIVANDGGAGYWFGGAIAMSGDVLLVGATGASGEQAGHGAVYVFSRNGSEWTQTGKLFADDGSVNANFGASVASDGRTVLVGAPQASGDFRIPDSYVAGAAYAFEQRRGEWRQAGTLRAEDPAVMEAFGASVAVHSDIALIGAPGARRSSGSFLRFQRDDDDDDETGGWEQEQRLRLSGDSRAGRLGEVIVNSSRHFAISAPLAETRDTYMPGVVFLYERDGDDIENEVRLTAGDWNAGDEFGSTLAINDDRLAVTAGNAGKIYVFERDDGWRESVRFAAPAADESFGAALAVFGNLIVAGAPRAVVNGNGSQGAVYVRPVPE